MACQSGQTTYDPYNLPSDDEEYLMPNNVAVTTPVRSVHAACLMTTARFHLNSPHELPQNWGQIIPNLNDYHSNQMEISSTFWLPDITDWWWLQGEMHSKYANLSNVRNNIFFIIPYGLGVEASVSLEPDGIRWRQSKTTGETVCEKVVVRQFTRANNRLLIVDDPVLDPTSTHNDMGRKREAEQKKLHQMAKVHYFVGMWHGSQNLRATLNESCAQNKQMTAVRYFSDTEEIVKASWSNFQNDSMVAFILLEQSPVPPAVSAMDLPGGQTQESNFHQIKRINRHSVECDDNCFLESISDTKNWLHWNRDLDNPNNSEDNREAANK